MNVRTGINYTWSSPIKKISRDVTNYILDVKCSAPSKNIDGGKAKSDV